MPIDVEIPTTIVGLIGLIVASETGLIYFLIKQLFGMMTEYAKLVSRIAEGDAAVANALKEVATAVTQGRDVDSLKKQYEELYRQVHTGGGRK